MNISYSRVSSYLRCPYQHWLSYVRRLERKKPVRPLYFGTDFHKLLELRNDPKALRQAKKAIKDAFYELPAPWQAELGDNYPQDLFTVFQDYNTVWEDSPQPQVTERPFELEVGHCKDEPIVFVGIIDELYLYKHRGEKHIYIGEHKTFSVKPNMDVLVMNTQKCLYAKAVQILKGVFPEKVIWDYIKSQPAEEPIWLEKSRRFSDASSTKITPMSWLRACDSRGITDEATLNKASKYAGNIPEFFFRVDMDLDRKMTDTIWDGFIYTVKQIIRQGERNTTHNLTRDCSYCAFRDICYTEMTGGNVEYVIARDYQEKQ